MRATSLARRQHHRPASAPPVNLLVGILPQERVKTYYCKKERALETVAGPTGRDRRRRRGRGPCCALIGFLS